MARMHQNMLHMPHCDKKDFRSRWLIGMTPWNQKYFVPEDIKPADKTGCPILCFFIFLHNPLLCLLLYLNQWLLCHKAFLLLILGYLGAHLYGPQLRAFH